MDLATILGLVATIGMMVWAMYLSAAGDLMMFYDFISIVIVFGGSITVVFMKFTLSQLGGSFKAAGKAFMFKMESPEELIEKAVQQAQTTPAMPTAPAAPTVTNGIELAIAQAASVVLART